MALAQCELSARYSLIHWQHSSNRHQNQEGDSKPETEANKLNLRFEKQNHCIKIATFTYKAWNMEHPNKIN